MTNKEQSFEIFSRYLEDFSKVKIEIDLSRFKDSITEAITKAFFVGDTVMPIGQGEDAVCVIFDTDNDWRTGDVPFRIRTLSGIFKAIGDCSICLREKEAGIGMGVFCFYIAKSCLTKLYDRLGDGSEQPFTKAWREIDNRDYVCEEY